MKSTPWYDQWRQVMVKGRSFPSGRRLEDLEMAQVGQSLNFLRHTWPQVLRHTWLPSTNDSIHQGLAWLLTIPDYQYHSAPLGTVSLRRKHMDGTLVDCSTTVTTQLLPRRLKHSTSTAKLQFRIGVEECGSGDESFLEFFKGIVGCGCPEQRLGIMVE